MPHPPDPLLPALLLLAAARLGVLVKVRDPTGSSADDLGVFVDGQVESPLGVESAGPIGSCQWTLALSSQRSIPFLISRATHELLQQAKANDDGSITSCAQRYTLREHWDGVRPVAELIPG